MSNDFRAEPAYFRGKFGVMLMDSGKFISESRLPAIIESTKRSDPHAAWRLRSAAARIAGLREVVEPSLTGERP